MTIYPLERGKPVVVSLEAARPRVVVTDGYHFTNPVELALQNLHVHYYKVVCTIEDEQLIFGAILLLLFYAAGLTSDLLFLKILSFVPLLYFLFIYYRNRASFLQLRPA